MEADESTGAETIHDEVADKETTEPSTETVDESTAEPKKHKRRSSKGVSKEELMEMEAERQARLDRLAQDKEMLQEKLAELERQKVAVGAELARRTGSSEEVALPRRSSSSQTIRTRRGDEPLTFDLLPRDVVFCVLSFLSDSDLYRLSIVSKRMCMYCFSDLLVFERRLKKQFPFDMTAMWRLIAKKYPPMGLAGSLLSLQEKTAVVNKYLRDVIDVNPNRWDVEGFDVFVENGVCSKDDRAAFYLFNVMRNPALRSEKVTDRFFGDAQLMKDTLTLFDLSGCTLFEALHVVFGHALSLPGEAQKIDRVMEAFGGAFRERCSEELREQNSEDAFFILAFAIVMLNSDLHNPAVKSRMSLSDFSRNLQGAIVLPPAVVEEYYGQVLRCEMLEGSFFTAKLSKTVWLVRSMGPLGYKRTKKATVTLAAGELSVDGTSERFALRHCLIARNVGSNHLATIRASGNNAEMPLLHVLRIDSEEEVNTLMAKRFSGDLIVTADSLEDLKELQRALSAHVLSGVQSKLNGTLKNIRQQVHRSTP